MGRSNRTAALERKIVLLMGEHEVKQEEIAKAERLAEQLPTLRERLWEIETLVSACETVIKSDHPEWRPDHLKPSKPFVHKIPVRLGNASKTALDVLRLADEPMTVRAIAIEVLKREGHENPDTDTMTKVANTVGQGLAKRRGTLGLVPESITDAAKGAETIKLILRNLAALTQYLAELRSLYASGHGRDGQHRGLQPRQPASRLARQFHLDFVTETYRDRQFREQTDIEGAGKVHKQASAAR